MYPWFVQQYHSIVERLQKRQLHHALLLAGEAGIGKADFALELAKMLLCRNIANLQPCEQCQSCQLYTVGNHPDFHLLDSEKQIGVDMVRDALSKLSRTSQLSGNKVLVIPAADTMTEAAANALLKTLEEPTANTYLLLVTSDLSRLLPTILSRCEKHALPKPKVTESLSWLAQSGLGDITEEQLRAYSNAPLLVKASVEENPGLHYSDFVAGLEGIIHANSDVTKLAGEWQDDARQVAHWCQNYLHEQFLKSPDPRVYSIYQKSIEAHQHLLHPGVNKKLVLSSLLAELSNLNFNQ